ncbi:hypothetical protein HG530_009784 [Fusarium avenaceum]|nr:hypothetical protein HG530_009784 [Fusarium avenaceum]
MARDWSSRAEHTIRRSCQKTDNDGGGYLEDIAVKGRVGSHNELQHSNQTAKGEDQREIDETGAKRKRRSCDTHDSEHDNSEPLVELVLALHQGIELLGCLLNSTDVVHDFLVDQMHILQLAQVDTLSGSDDPDFGCVGGLVIE